MDVQKAFFKISPATAQWLNDAIEYIHVAVALLGERGHPVICVQHMDEEESLVPGEEGSGLPDQLDVLASDLHTHKTYPNSFNRTSLEKRLAEYDADTPIITGFSAEYCVLSTYRGAKDLDLTPIVLRGSLAGSTPKNIRFVVSTSDFECYGVLKEILG